MNLTPLQGRLLFGLIVVVFAGLAAFLLLPRQPAAQKSAPPDRTPGTASAAGPASGPATGPTTGPDLPVTSPSSSPAPSGTPQPSPSLPPSVDIYRLLPFSQAGLDQAVGLTQRFADDYGTYSYRQDAAEYVAPMRGLVSAGLAQTLARGYATPGLVRTRTRQKQVSSGRATVTALRAFGPTSLTFLVTVVQTITAVPGSSHLTGDYAVTVAMVGGHWQVNNIELATAGNS